MIGLARTGWLIRFSIGRAILEVMGIPCDRSKKWTSLNKQLHVITYYTTPFSDTLWKCTVRV